MKTRDKHIFIDIYLQKNQKFNKAGKITFNDDSHTAYFSYFEKYLESEFPTLNPATLNWKESNSNVFHVNPTYHLEQLDKTFWEMLPTENDWGHIVLSKRYPEYDYLNNAQKLFFLEKRIVGGLDAYINENSKEENIIGLDWLDYVRDESISFYMNKIEKISHIKAINPLTSYGGVRPKCMFEDDEGQFWIAKFNLPSDDYDMALAEQIASEMANDCGLDCAKSKVITLPSGENVFLSQRFDRVNNKRFHSLSLYSLFPEFKVNNKTGSFIQNILLSYTNFKEKDNLNLLTKFLFDIGINNTDNHMKNFRIMLNHEDKWELSPFYDINFSTFNTNHLYQLVNLEQIFLSHPNFLENFSKTYNVNMDWVYETIKKIFNVLENWEYYCDKYNMSETDKLKIGNAITLGLYKQSINQKNKSQLFIKKTLAPKLTPNKN